MTTSSSDADGLLLSPQQAEAVVRIVESAPHVRRRYQFFVWAQSQLQSLLPHRVMVCGAYQRQQRQVVYEVFQSIVLEGLVVDALSDGDGPLMRSVVSAWIEGRGRPLVLGLDRLAPGPAIDALRAAGFDGLLVHGVSRPQRPSEIESLFVMGDPHRPAAAGAAMRAELLLPHLHTTWQRVVAAEREIVPPGPPPRRDPLPEPEGRSITERERQILAWIREGKSNQQIAEVLGISPLTVKNHVQKILRKLNVSNRAQAAANSVKQGTADTPGDMGKGLDASGHGGQALSN